MIYQVNQQLALANTVINKRSDFTKSR